MYRSLCLKVMPQKHQDKELLNNQLIMMTHPREMSQTLSSVTQFFCNGPINNVSAVAGIMAMKGLRLT